VREATIGTIKLDNSACKPPLSCAPDDGNEKGPVPIDGIDDEIMPRQVDKPLPQCPSLSHHELNLPSVFDGAGQVYQAQDEENEETNDDFEDYRPAWSMGKVGCERSRVFPPSDHPCSLSSLPPPASLLHVHKDGQSGQANRHRKLPQRYIRFLHRGHGSFLLMTACPRFLVRLPGGVIDKRCLVHGVLVRTRVLLDVTLTPGGWSSGGERMATPPAILQEASRERGGQGGETPPRSRPQNTPNIEAP